MHAKRWAVKDEPGVLSSPEVLGFHREVIPHFSSTGLLRLHTLWLDDQAIAVFFGFHVHDRTYYYLSGYDPDFQYIEPGHLAVYHAIQTAANEGAHSFDFLRGQEIYKYRWGAVDRWNHRIRAFTS